MNHYIIGQRDKYHNSWGTVRGLPPYETYTEAENNLAAVSREHGDSTVAVCCLQPKRPTWLPVSDQYEAGEKLFGSPLIFARPGVEVGYILTSVGFVFARLSENAHQYDSQTYNDLYGQILAAEPGDIVYFDKYLFFRTKRSYTPEKLR